MVIEVTMIVFNKYRVLEPINRGSYGTVYKGKNIRTGELVAIKMEAKTDTSLLPNEAKLYIYLSNIVGIPEAKWFGAQGDKHVLVMNLLDDSLTKRKTRSGPMEWNAVANIGIQMIKRLQSIHEKELVHRDVKPDNWLFKGDVLYLIDFGFCKRYQLADGSHVPWKQTSNIIGTLNYVSVNVHAREEPSRRDDLESVVYILMYLLEAEGLPWENVSDPDMVAEMKMRMDSVPWELRDMLTYIRQLRFDEYPDYAWLLRRLGYADLV